MGYGFSCRQLSSRAVSSTVRDLDDRASAHTHTFTINQNFSSLAIRPQEDGFIVHLLCGVARLTLLSFQELKPLFSIAHGTCPGFIASRNAAAYRIRDTISETDQFGFALIVLPVRKQCKDQGQSRRV